MHTTPVAPTIDTSRPSESRRDDSTQLVHDEPFDAVLERHSAPTQPSDRDRGDTAPRSDRAMERRRMGRDGSAAAMKPRRSDPAAKRSDTEHPDDVDNDRHRDEDADADIESSTHPAEAGVCTPTARLAIADGTSQADVAQPVGEATRVVALASTAQAGSAGALESRRPEIRQALPTDRSPSVVPHAPAIESEGVAPSAPNQQASTAPFTTDEVPTIPTQAAADPIDTPRTSADALIDAPADQANAATATDSGAARPEMPSSVEPAHDLSRPTLPDPGTPAEVASSGEIRSTDVRSTEIHSADAHADDPSPELLPQALTPEAQAAESTGVEMPTREVTSRDATARGAAAATATPSPDSDPATPTSTEIPSDSEITIEDDADAARPSRSESSSGADHPAADDASVPLHTTTPSTRTARPVQPGRVGHGADSVRQHAEVPERSLLAQAELRRATSNGRRLDMGITTSDLGRVRVTAIEGAEGLQLQLSSDQTGGRAHLNQHLHELRADLTNRGLDIGSLDVGAGDTGADRDTSEPPATPRMTTAAAADQTVDPVGAVSNHGSAPIPRHLDGLDLRL